MARKQRDRAELLLREPNLYKAFLLLALPVFGANFMKAFNELVDTFFIGKIANSVAAPAIEFKKEGQVFGIGCKIFTIAGPVILYGIFSSFILGLIYFIFQKL